MRALLRPLFLRSVLPAAALCLSLFTGAPTTRADPTCLATSLARLRAAAPDGYAIYRQVDNPAFFKNWIRCDDAQFDLPTAVHESTHYVTTETDAFPLIGGGAIAMPHEVSAFFPPTRIAEKFERDDLTAIYLRMGKASSATDFLVLLDELNAYSHDLSAAVDLKSLASPDVSVDHRDGVAAMMAFVAVYVATARAGDSPAAMETWRGLQQPRAAGAIATLWGQAEHVLASSCDIPNYGTLDKIYIRRICTAEAQAALTPILGRAPICPTACLGPEPDIEVTSTIPPRPSSSPWPSWIRQIIKFKATESDPVADNVGSPINRP